MPDNVIIFLDLIQEKKKKKNVSELWSSGCVDKECWHDMDSFSIKLSRFFLFTEVEEISKKLL